MFVAIYAWPHLASAGLSHKTRSFQVFVAISLMYLHLVKYKMHVTYNCCSFLFTMNSDDFRRKME